MRDPSGRHGRVLRAVAVACLMSCCASAVLAQAAVAGQGGARFAPGQPTGRMGPYFGESPPDVTPRVFAPGIVSRPETVDYAASMSPDGREFYFTRNGSPQVILVSRLGALGWTYPEPVTFSAGHSAHEPHVTFDNRRIFWGWFHPTPPGYGIYVAERTPAGWSESRYVGRGGAISSTRDGRLFVTIFGEPNYLAEVTLADGRFGVRERLRGGMDAPELRRTPAGTQHPAIAPDGSYVVFDIGGGSHLFVCFRNPDGTWGDAIDLTRHGIPPEGGIASISPDGRYLFFGAGGDIYWVSTRLIEDLRPGAQRAPALR